MSRAGRVKAGLKLHNLKCAFFLVWEHTVTLLGTAF